MQVDKNFVNICEHLFTFQWPERFPWENPKQLNKGKYFPCHKSRQVDFLLHWVVPASFADRQGSPRSDNAFERHRNNSSKEQRWHLIHSPDRPLETTTHRASSYLGGKPESTACSGLIAGEPYQWTVVGDNQPSHCFVIFDEVLCGSRWLLGLVCTLFSSHALVRVMSYGLNEWLRLDLSTCIYLACVSGCLQPSSIILHNALMWFDGRSVCLCGPGWKTWPRLMSRVIRSELLNPPFSLFSLIRLSGRLSNLPVVMNNDYMTGLATQKSWLNSFGLFSEQLHHH